jgi:hypothetical protein
MESRIFFTSGKYSVVSFGNLGNEEVDKWSSLIIISILMMAVAGGVCQQLC